MGKWVERLDKLKPDQSDTMEYGGDGIEEFVELLPNMRKHHLRAYNIICKDIINDKKPFIDNPELSYIILKHLPNFKGKFMKKIDHHLADGYKRDKESISDLIKKNEEDFKEHNLGNALDLPDFQDCIIKSIDITEESLYDQYNVLDIIDHKQKYKNELAKYVVSELIKTTKDTPENVTEVTRNYLEKFTNNKIEIDNEQFKRLIENIAISAKLDIDERKQIVKFKDMLIRKDGKDGELTKYWSEQWKDHILEENQSNNEYLLNGDYLKFILDEDIVDDEELLKLCKILEDKKNYPNVSKLQHSLIVKQLNQICHGNQKCKKEHGLVKRLENSDVNTIQDNEQLGRLINEIIMSTKHEVDEYKQIIKFKDMLIRKDGEDGELTKYWSERWQKIVFEKNPIIDKDSINNEYLKFVLTYDVLGSSYLNKIYLKLASSYDSNQKQIHGIIWKNIDKINFNYKDYPTNKLIEKIVDSIEYTNSPIDERRKQICTKLNSKLPRESGIIKRIIDSINFDSRDEKKWRYWELEDDKEIKNKLVIKRLLDVVDKIDENKLNFIKKHNITKYRNADDELIKLCDLLNDMLIRSGDEIRDWGNQVRRNSIKKLFKNICDNNTKCNERAYP